MFIFLAYVSLALIQLYRQCQRRLQYSAAMLRAVRSGSILVQRGKCAQHGSVGALLDSSLLSCSRSYRETLLLSDEHLAISTVSPKQQVDLGEWTSYLELHPAQSSSNSVVALLEAGPPDSGEKTPLQVPPGSRVHVLKHGCPLAWKSGNPFGIIMHCSYEDFIILCDAFGQGQLTLNEDLQLHRMLTISTLGKPKSLRRPKSEEIPSTADSKHDLKTKRANTDPVRLLPSMDGQLPACVLATPQSGAGAVRAEGTDMNSSAKPHAGSGSSVVQRGEDSGAEVPDSERLVGESATSGVHKSIETAASEKSVGGDSTDRLSDKPSEVTNNGSAVMVQEKIVALEESPVIQMVPSLASSSGKNAQAHSSDLLDKCESLPADAHGDGQDRQVKGVSEEGVLPSSDSGNTSSKNIPPAALNGCKKYNETSVKDDSLSFAESRQLTLKESTVKESNSERNDGMKRPATEKSVSVPPKSSNASSTVSGSLKESVKTDTEGSASFNGSQQDCNKLENAAYSVNGSSTFLNGSGTAAIPTQSLEPPKEVAKAGATAVSCPEPLQNMSTDGGGQTPQSEPAVSSENSAHDADGVSGGDTRYKPPNVVVYCGKKDSARKFDMIREGLEQCLNSSAYTVYILPHEEVMTLPWEDSSAALIISHDYLHDNIGNKFTRYLLNGGKVLSFGSSLEADFLVRKEVKGQPAVTKFSLQKWRDVSAIQGRYHYTPGSLKKGNSSMETLVMDPASAQPLVVRLMLSPHNGNGKAIFSQLFLERDPSEMAADSKTFSRLKQSSKLRLEVLRHLLSLLDLDTSASPDVSLTPCYLLVQEQALRKSFLDSIAGRMKQDVIRSRSLSLKFASSKAGPSSLVATKDTLPVITDVPAGSSKEAQGAGNLLHFDPEVYWRHLTTSMWGQVVMYTDIITSTMTIFEGIQFSLPEDVGVIAVAGRQTSGKGRGGNQWLSPVGCAMFTLPLRLPVESPLGQRVSFLQHLAALSVVHSLRTLPGYEDLDLRLKWPNDIYYGNKAKLGGVLVNSTVMGKTMHATVGCGLNVSNSLPTICINSIIQEHNRAQGLNLKPLTTSEVLARTVSTMEGLVAQFQDKGHKDFCQLYYKYWLHSGARVKVESEGNAEVEIVGLDDFGFLHVVNKQGQQLSVQPDGNSFDMLHNLICVKRD